MATDVISSALAPYVSSFFGAPKNEFEAYIAQWDIGSRFDPGQSLALINTYRTQYGLDLSDQEIAAGVTRFGNWHQSRFGSGLTAASSSVAVAAQSLMEAANLKNPGAGDDFWSRFTASGDLSRGADDAYARGQAATQTLLATQRAAMPQEDDDWFGDLVMAVTPLAMAVVVGVSAFAEFAGTAVVAEQAAAPVFDAVTTAVDSSLWETVASGVTEVVTPTVTTIDLTGSAVLEAGSSIVAEQAAAPVVDAVIKAVEPSLIDSVISTAKAVQSVVSPITTTMQIVNKLTGQTSTVPGNAPVPTGWGVRSNPITEQLQTRYDPATGAIIMETPQGLPQSGATPQATNVVASDSSAPAVLILAGLAAVVFYLVR